VIFVSRRALRTAALLFIFLGFSALAFSEEPLSASVCQLKSDPASFNHKLVRITSFMSHGFEDFSLQDPMCGSWFDIWLEYGGKSASGTVYCCGGSGERTRPKQIEVEGISIPLTEDRNFQTFDKLLHVPNTDTMVRATIIGRFFSGEKTLRRDGKAQWAGYGHLGCCSLLIIQQVLSVDPRNRNDLDYETFAEQPDLKHCGYRDLTPLQPYRDMLDAQENAEMGERAWAFDDPQRVAVDALAGLLKITPGLITGVKREKASQGKVIYKWHPKGKPVRYRVVVTRPYWLSFYSRQQGKVAWVVAAAYEECGP
jgi:hypothetical protein